MLFGTAVMAAWFTWVAKSDPKGMWFFVLGVAIADIAIAIFK